MTNRKNKLWLISLTAVMCIFLAVSFLAGCKTTAETKAAAETTAAETKAAETKAAETKAPETTAAVLKFEGQSLLISGSTTLLEVSNSWAEAFMAKFGGEVTVNGGGSGVGIADLINKANDLGNASRQIKDEEVEEAKAAGVEVKEFIVLYDGIAVIVSKNIDLAKITIEQLSDIYTGKITNWSEVGGPDAEIVAAGRDSSSGTGEYFLERVVQLNKTIKDNDYGDVVLRLQSNADVAGQVADNDNCIGYISLGYLESVSGKANTVGVMAEGAADAVMPTLETVLAKTYPISRDLYVYANSNNMSEIAQAFVDFMLSEEGQQVGADSGFVGVK